SQVPPVPPPTAPTTWNMKAVWPPPTGLVEPTQVDMSDHVEHVVPKPPPGFCHFALEPVLPGEKSLQNTWPPTPKSRLTTISTQYVPCERTHGVGSATERAVLPPESTPVAAG